MKLQPDAIKDILIYLEGNIKYVQDEDTGLRIKKSFKSNDIADAIYSDKKKYEYDELIYAMEEMVNEEYIHPTLPPTKDTSGNFIDFEVNDLMSNGREVLNGMHKEPIWKAVKKGAKTTGIFSLKSLLTTVNSLSLAFMSDPDSIPNLVKGWKKALDFLQNVAK